MKKRVCVPAIILLVAAFCLTATSCLSLLNQALDIVYRSAFDTDTIDRETVYGDANSLAVTFEGGKMYATWDVDDAYTYSLGVKNDEGTITYPYDGSNSNEALVLGRTDLSALGYTFSENLSLTLYKTQQSLSYSRSTTVGYSYAKMSASAYDKYTKPVKAGFSEIDYYMGTRAELFDFWSYLLIFREGCKYEDGCYALEANVYMGYDYLSLYSTNDVEKAFANEVYSAIDAYEDSAAYTYSFEVDDTGKYGTFLMKFTYDNNPKFTSNSARTYKNALHTATDNRHYSITQNERTFAVDDDRNVKGTISVSASDQLYFAMKKGYRPVPTKGSNAEYLYEEMRRILTYVVDDDDTESEKAHEIYDYIVDTVVYDYEFTDVIYKDDDYTTGQLFSYSCLYLEGVFGFNAGTFDDNYKTAICDGLSKAFLCMARIEGMDAIKISGTVNDEGHAWNKVKIDGAWYMVDTTWGNTLDENTKYEYLNHEYLLVRDDNKHKETPYITYPDATRTYDFHGAINNDPNGSGGSITPWTFGWGRHPRYAA